MTTSTLRLTRERANGMSEGAKALLGFLSTLVFVQFLWGITNLYGAEELEAACKGRRGVVQVQPESRFLFTGGSKYVALVVCRDGSVQGVK